MGRYLERGLGVLRKVFISFNYEGIYICSNREKENNNYHLKDKITSMKYAVLCNKIIYFVFSYIRDNNVSLWYYQKNRILFSPFYRIKSVKPNKYLSAQTCKKLLDLYFVTLLEAPRKNYCTIRCNENKLRISVPGFFFAISERIYRR